MTAIPEKKNPTEQLDIRSKVERVWQGEEAVQSRFLMPCPTVGYLPALATLCYNLSTEKKVGRSVNSTSPIHQRDAHGHPAFNADHRNKQTPFRYPHGHGARAAVRPIPSPCPGATMPIHSEMKDLFPADWPEISQRIRFQRAGGHFEWCTAEHGQSHPDIGSKVILTSAHLDHNLANNSKSNLAALCQKCHNTYDSGKRHGNRVRRAHTVQPLAPPPPTPVPAAPPPIARCSIENVPEPPYPNLDCEAWGTTYKLISIELDYFPPASELVRIAKEVYPLLVSGSKACGVSSTIFFDYIVAASQQVKREGKPLQQPGYPIAYLLGAVGVDEFHEIVALTGG